MTSVARNAHMPRVTASFCWSASSNWCATSPWPCPCGALGPMSIESWALANVPVVGLVVVAWLMSHTVGRSAQRFRSSSVDLRPGQPGRPAGHRAVLRADAQVLGLLVGVVVRLLRHDGSLLEVLGGRRGGRRPL